MSIESLRVLSFDSVQELRRIVPARPELTALPFEELLAELRLNLVRSAYLFDSGVSLFIPRGISQEENMDVANCRQMLQALPGLTPALATDDRLWVTLTFSVFREYTLARWPIGARGEENQASNIKNHFFASGVRGRMRDNSVSRLWWMGHIASRVESLHPDEVFGILYSNSDYRSNLLERNSTSNATPVLSAILEITREAYQKGIAYQRPAFRSFMSRVDLLGGRCNLAALSSSELISKLRPLYAAAYEAAI